MTATKTFFLFAGEASGDVLGAGLMTALERQYGVQKFVGVGGRHMVAQGLISRFDMAEVALMGLRQIVPRIPALLRRIAQLARDIANLRPDAIVLIDSPDFTHRLARAVHRRNPDLPILIYVAPSVWAWRPRRAAAMRRWCHQVLAVLPFEPQVFRSLNGPPCAYVGHPAIYASPKASQGQQWRAHHQLGTRPLLAVLPGSRRNEIKSLLPVFGDTVARCRQHMPNLAVAVLVADSVRAQVQAGLKRWAQTRDIIVLDAPADKQAASSAANLALAASGTAVLELALAGTPAVGAYTTDPFLRWMLVRVMRVPSVLLPNLILDAPILPEFLGTRCRADLMCDTILDILGSAPRQKAMRAALMRLRKRMRVKEDFPQARAADLVWQAAQ